MEAEDPELPPRCTAGSPATLAERLSDTMRTFDALLD